MSQAGSNSSGGGGGGGPLNTLTGDSGAPVAPVAGNINVLGLGDLYDVVGTVGTLTITPTSGAFPVTPYVVGPIGQAGYQTVQSAINAASLAGGGTVYVLPGTYTENLTFAANVNVIGNNLEGRLQAIVDSLAIPASDTLIIGNHTFSVTGAIFLEGLAFTSPAGDLITVTVPAASSNFLGFKYCYFNSFGAGRGIFATAPGAISIILLSSSSLNSGAAPALEMQERCHLNLSEVSLSSNTVTLVVGGPNSEVNLTENCNLSGQVLITDATSLLESFGSSINASNPVSCISFTAAGSFLSIDDEFISTNPSTFYIDGTGTYTYGGSIARGSAINIDPAIIQQPQLMRPTATTTVRGTASFNSAHFTVVDGFVSSIASPFVWSSINANQTLVASNGYFVSGGALSLALPASAVIGDTISVVLAPGGTSWTITQAAGQSIVVGNMTSTVGVGGSVASTQPGNTIDIVYFAADTWQATNLVGTLTIT